MDSLVQPYSNQTVNVGGKHLNDYLLSLLQKDEKLVQQCQQAGIELDTSFAQFIRERPETCHVAVGYELQETSSATEGVPLMGSGTAQDEEIADNEAQGDEDDEPKDIPEYLDVEYQGHKVR